MGCSAYCSGLGCRSLLLAFTHRPAHQIIRYIANLFTTLAFLLSCWLVSLYDQHDAALQFNEYFPLNPDLGSAYALGIDGFIHAMLVLATLLT